MKMDGESDRSEEKESLTLTSDLIKSTINDVSRICDKVNRMDPAELRQRLRYYKIKRGQDDRRKLKSFYSKMKFASIGVYMNSSLKPYYVVIDFEATCQKVNTPTFQSEIIEFPAVLIRSKTLEVVDTFQMYCKPVINPKLTDFCVELTGITQEQVDTAQNFSHVLNCFEQWLEKHKLCSKNKFVIVTDSAQDLSRFLFYQCLYSDVPYPEWAKRWVNLKRSFSCFYGICSMPLRDMLSCLEMQFEGRYHCGLDDAKNIARVLVRMIKDGANIHANEMIKMKYKKLLHVSENGIDGSVNEENSVNELNRKMSKLKVEDVVVRHIREKDRLSTHEIVKNNAKKLQAQIYKALSDKGGFQDEELSKPTLPLPVRYR